MTPHFLANNCFVIKWRSYRAIEIVGQKQPGQAEVLVRCSKCCKCPVYKFLQYFREFRHIPANFRHRLVCQISQLQDIQEIKRFQCQKVELESLLCGA